MKWCLLFLGLATSPAWGGCNLTMLSVAEWKIEVVDGDTNRLFTTVRSNAEKPIRMIDASVTFTDALGGRIASYAMQRDVALSPGGEFKEENLWGKYTFERLLKLETDEVETAVCVKAVLFDDGTKQTY